MGFTTRLPDAGRPRGRPCAHHLHWLRWEVVCVAVFTAEAVLAGTKPVIAQSGSGPVAIVVHPETMVSELSSTQLRSIFLAEQQFWPDHSRITLLVRAPVAVERDMVTDRIYRMDESQFRQYWIAKMFRAEIATGPKLVNSSAMAIQLVTAIRGAITFVPATSIEPGMRVIAIDGKRPGEPGYPLN